MNTRYVTALLFFTPLFAREAHVPDTTVLSTDIVTARVFIHGTILAGYFFVDIPASWKDQYQENSLIERAMASARRDPFLLHTDLLLDLGLTDVTDKVTVPLSHPLADETAAITIMRTFERTDRCIRLGNNPFHYYTFGWSGALSERKRNRESVFLYESLMSIKRDLSHRHPHARIRFELYAHSHGGQLIAHLAVIHKQMPQSDLFIDLAVLCATPLYKEKVQPMISSPLFGTILNLYSEGDKVQNLDIVSTPEHYCVRRFAELDIPLPSPNCPGPVIADVALHVHDNPKVFGHESFFCCSAYRLASHFTKRRHIRSTVDLFKPLPVLVMMPTCIQSVTKVADYKPGFHDLVINFEQKNGILTLNTSRYDAYHAEKTLCDKQLFTIHPFSYEFITDYLKRARKKTFNHIKHTFYHLMHS